MAVFQSEDRLRQKRQRSEKAIQLAMQSRWQEAVDLNRQIIAQFPNDVDSLNRLGKALMELGSYGEARDTYQQAAKQDPSNTIATKNLARLSKLVEEAADAPAAGHAPVDPRLFIEESGKTAVTNLVDVPAFETIATLTAGDRMDLRVEGGAVRVITPSGLVIGQLEPKIGQRVIRLTEMGNKYTATITSIDEQHVRVIIREAFRHPSMGSRPSFPTQSPEIRPYTKDSVFRSDLDDEDDEDAVDEIESDAEAGDGVEVPLEEAAANEDTDLNDES